MTVQQLDFMGHQLIAQGLKPDPSKVEAILKLESSKTKVDIERLNGTVNYLANPAKAFSGHEATPKAYSERR